MHRLLALLLLTSLPLGLSAQVNNVPVPAPPAVSAPSPQATPASTARQGFRVTSQGLPIFGSQLFQGDFRDLSFTGFNPHYQVGVSDSIQVMIWGALEVTLTLTVDPRGNIFLPNVGPVPVLGIRNEDLNKVVAEHIRRTYKDNVESYANLLSTQSVKVFVSGFVAQPGLYEGFASDSVLSFLDRAGGIDPARGSYLNIALVRDQAVVTRLNLYEFLEKGMLPLTQFRDGDVILVEPRGHTAQVTGQVINPARFEFTGTSVSLDRLLALASPASDATSVSVRRARGGETGAIVVPLADAASVTLEPGDLVEVTGRHIPRSLLISYTGEHQGPSDLVLRQGSLLSDALDRIQPAPLSDLQSVQIFRRSVAARQKALLLQSLDNLERTVLGAPSSTLEEARLRQAEAETILAFIRRAREVEPRGQILLNSLADADSLHLEDGDIIHIPALSNLVTIHGEVKYPNTQTHRDRDTLARYIARAGGFTDKANQSEIIVIRPDGLIETVSRARSIRLGPGDEVIVLPKPDPKRLLVARELSTIIYQIALGARVVIGL